MALNISSTNLFKTTDRLGRGTGKLRNTSSNIGKSLQNQSVLKRKSIISRKNIYARRASAISRKKQNDIVEVSRATGSRKGVGQIVRESNKGFFGRILEAVSYALIGWTIQNLPTIVMMANKLGQQLPKLTNLLSSFMTTTFSVFQEIGNLSSGLVRSLLAFDFNSMGRQVQTSLGNLSVQFEKLENDLFEGMKIFGEVFKIDENRPQNQQPPRQPTPPSTPGGPTGTSYGVNLKSLADATSKAEGNYGSVGRTTYLGHGMGRYQFMTGRSDTQQILLKNAGNNKAQVQALINRSLGGDRSAALQLIKYFPPKDQDALFATHAQNTLTQIKRKYPNADEFFLVQKFGVYHLTGGDYPNSRDRNGTSGKQHGDKILDAYKNLKGRTPTAPPPAPTPGPNVPFTVPQLNPNLKYQKGGVLTGTIGRGVPYVQIGDVVGAPRRHGPHQGIDIFAPTGTFIALRLTGKVLFAGWQNPNDHLSGYGLMVDMWVPELGVQLRFGHCDQLLCSTGNTIKAGQSFATVGYTGNATPKNNDGAHIHFEYTREYNSSNYGTAGDPSPYIPFLILSAVRLSGSNASTNTNNRRNLAQTAPAGTNLNNVDSITPTNEGETLYITVPPQAYQNSAMGGGFVNQSGPLIISPGNGLNSLMKQRILLELAYT